MILPRLMQHSLFFKWWQWCSAVESQQEALGFDPRQGSHTGQYVVLVSMFHPGALDFSNSPKIGLTGYNKLLYWYPATRMHKSVYCIFLIATLTYFLNDILLLYSFASNNSTIIFSLCKPCITF